MLCFILSEKKNFNSVLFRTANLKLKTKNLDIEGRGLESKVPEMRLLLEWLGVILKKSFRNSSWIIIIIILNMILIMMKIKVMQYDSGDNCNGKNVLFILNDQQEETKSLPKNTLPGCQKIFSAQGNRFSNKKWRLTLLSQFWEADCCSGHSGYKQLFQWHECSSV